MYDAIALLCAGVIYPALYISALKFRDEIFLSAFIKYKCNLLTWPF